MKTRPSRRRRGFTLIELLVVIAIIAVLAAASFGMVNLAMKKARQQVARQACVSLQQAINQFYDTYGTLPSASTTAPTTDNTTSPIDTTSANGLTLLTILLGKETTTTKVNTKGINFLNVPDAKNKKGGLAYDSGNTLQGLFDPWGNGYRVVIDYDYDEEMTPPSETSTTQPTVLHGRHALAYSMGVEKAGKAETVKDW